jgi:fructuronate reductase
MLHFGIGAFHRAHQAVYTDDALAAGDRDWLITGVSLRSAGVATQLNPQLGLYTVTERSARDSTTRLIGCVREVLVAGAQSQRVIEELAAPALRIVSFTITEKGYGRAADGRLDPALSGPGSVWHYLRRGLSARRAAGLHGLTLLSCDNLSGNGRQLAGLLQQALEGPDPSLARWAAAECRCPSTMVDRIVPASTPEERTRLSGHIGLEDEAAVFTEPFRQWVIEDDFAGPRPHWEAGGAQFVGDVGPWETAKLRMLNGAHSLLAYLGRPRGHQFVHEAAADPELRALTRRLILEEAAPTLPPMTGFDAAAYAAALQQRFINPALAHRLEQIAMDGSQKIPQRWLPVLTARSAGGGDCPALLRALAGWIRYVRGDRFAVDDPEAQRLAALWAEGGAARVVDALFTAPGIFAACWQPTTQQRAELLRLIHAAG